MTRLRPERPKREIPDYEYRDNYTRISVGNGNTHLKTISKKMKLMDEDDYGDDEDNILINGKNGFERSDSVEVRQFKIAIVLSFYACRMPFTHALHPYEYVLYASS